MKLVLPIVAFGIILVTRLGIAQNAPPAPGDSIQTMEVNGAKRIYRLHIPQGYDGATAMPLVFALHGRGGNGMGMEQGTGWGLKADKEHFVAVFPNALGQPQTWNSGLNPELTGNADDVEFIRELMDRLESTLNIDKRRIYCCGMSSGAIMTGRLGAELSDRFAALGIASGTVGAKQGDGSERTISKPANPVPVIAFHGKKDGTVFFNGGGTLANCFPVARSLSFWRESAGRSCFSGELSVGQRVRCRVVHRRPVCDVGRFARGAISCARRSSEPFQRRWSAGDGFKNVAGA